MRRYLTCYWLPLKLKDRVLEWKEQGLSEAFTLVHAHACNTYGGTCPFALCIKRDRNLFNRHDASLRTQIFRLQVVMTFGSTSTTSIRINEKCKVIPMDVGFHSTRFRAIRQVVKTPACHSIRDYLCECVLYYQIPPSLQLIPPMPRWENILQRLLHLALFLFLSLSLSIPPPPPLLLFSNNRRRTDWQLPIGFLGK